MLCIDKSGDSAGLLDLGDRMKGQRRLARRFRPEDFDDASAGKTADSQRDIEAKGTGRYRRNVDRGLGVPELHDGAFSVLFFDLGKGEIQRAFLFVFFRHG